MESFEKADRLTSEFAPRSVRNDGSLLRLRSSDALALVNRAAEEGVPIVGIHSFYDSPDRTESPPEHLVDFSAAVAEGHGCWAEAEAFIRERSDHALVFELTLGDDPIEAV